MQKYGIVIVALLLFSVQTQTNSRLCDSEVETLKSELGLLEAEAKGNEAKLYDLDLETEEHINSIDFGEVVNLFEQNQQNSGESDLQRQLNEKNEQLDNCKVEQLQSEQMLTYIRQKLIQSENNLTNCQAHKDNEMSQLQAKYDETKASADQCTNSLLTRPKLTTANSCQHYVNYKGMYKMTIPGLPDFEVYCDSDWTVIERHDNRRWQFNKYDIGFDSAQVYRKTRSQPLELLIYMIDDNKRLTYAHYTEFAIGTMDGMLRKYELKRLGQFSGSPGQVDLLRNCVGHFANCLDNVLSYKLASMTMIRTRI